MFNRNISISGNLINRNRHDNKWVISQLSLQVEALIEQEKMSDIREISAFENDHLGKTKYRTKRVRLLVVIS